MKRNRTRLILLAALTAAALTAGCSSKSKTAFFDSINKIEVGATLEDINGIVGSDGVASETSEYEYSWQFEQGRLEIRFSKPGGQGGANYIELKDYDSKEITDSKAVIKDLQTLKAKVNAGLSYDGFKEYLGGSEGVLVYKSSSQTGYEWRSSSGSSVSAKFRASDSMCTFFSGFER